MLCPFAIRMGLFSCCTLVVGFVYGTSRASASDWLNDFQLAADDGDAAEAPAGGYHDDGYYDVGGDYSDSACYGNASTCHSCDCQSGDCHYGLTEEFTQRLAAMQQSLACCGLTYQMAATQFYQGVAHGGNEQDFEYGGKVDQFIILDSGKLGLWQGMTMTMHVETRFGQDVNFEAVGLAPVNVAMLYPKFNEHDTAITGLSFAQALNEETQVTFGKFNALDLFYMLYPQTGRGIEGFMNASMVIPISIARVAPLSFMGAGAMKLHGKQVQGSLLVYDTQNVATTSGFDDMFDNGANIMAYWRFFTDVNGLPGSHGFAGIWSTGEFTAFDPTGFVIIPGEGIVAPTDDGAYTLLYILEQTLWQDHCNPNHTVGLLSQWGIADETTSPFSWSANVGIQARGMNECRPQDSMGIGYFHTGISDDLQNLLAPTALEVDDINGVEVYYNAAVAKCCNVTADLQVIDGGNEANATALVVGVRASIGL